MDDQEPSATMYTGLGALAKRVRSMQAAVEQLRLPTYTAEGRRLISLHTHISVQVWWICRVSGKIGQMTGKNVGTDHTAIIYFLVGCSDEVSASQRR